MVRNGMIRRDAVGLALHNAWSGAADSTVVTPTQSRKVEDCPFLWLVKAQPWKSPRLWWSPNPDHSCGLCNSGFGACFQRGCSRRVGYFSLYCRLRDILLVKLWSLVFLFLLIFYFWSKGTSGGITDRPGDPSMQLDGTATQADGDHQRDSDWGQRAEHPAQSLSSADI